MDNVVSIFTGKSPCGNLFLHEEEFSQMLKADSTWGIHVWDCQDCLKRYLGSNRESLKEALNDIISAHGFDDIHDD